MSTGLIENSAKELLPAQTDSILPVFESVRDISRCIAQSDTIKTNKTRIKPLLLLSYIWRVIRELSGDDAYERYIAQHAIKFPDAKPLARKDFFHCQQQEKWNGIRRCC
jgi:uncharacterized short protein YbdD (DUF466 family)